MDVGSLTQKQCDAAIAKLKAANPDPGEDPVYWGKLAQLLDRKIRLQAEAGQRRYRKQKGALDGAPLQGD